MFTKKDVGFLEEVFSLTRLQVVNSDPKNKESIENIINFERFIVEKCMKANEKLGYVEKEEESEIKTFPTEEVNTAADQVATD